MLGRLPENLISQSKNKNLFFFKFLSIITLVHSFVMDNFNKKDYF